LTASRRSALRPVDDRARLIGTLLNERMAGKGVAEDAAEVIEDLGTVEAVGEVELRSAGVEAIGVLGDLDGNAAGDGVSVEGLCVRASLGGEGVWTVDLRVDRPESGLKVAFIDDTSLANGSGERGGDGQKAKDSSFGHHIDSLTYFVSWSWSCEVVMKKFLELPVFFVAEYATMDRGPKGLLIDVSVSNGMKLATSRMGLLVSRAIYTV
jgi:hypothetical protein